MQPEGLALPTTEFYVKHWIRPTSTLALNHLKDYPAAHMERDMYYMRIHNSIQYITLYTQDYSTYEEYLKTTNQTNHSVEQFKKLQAEWDYNKITPIRCTIEKYKCVIIDGLHRAAIYLFLTKKDSIPFSMIQMEFQPITIKRIKDALALTTKIHHASGWSNDRLPHGYHSFSLWNLQTQGQRHPLYRLNIMRKHLDFTNKTVTDIGCNSGGSVFHALEIYSAHGVDIDTNCIQAAKLIREEFQLYHRHTFQQADLETADLIPTLYPRGRTDITFLLSLGSWIRRWREVYQTAIDHSDTIFLETNNDAEGSAQIRLLEDAGMEVRMIAMNSLDDVTGNHGRKLYICDRRKLKPTE